MQNCCRFSEAAAYYYFNSSKACNLNRIGGASAALTQINNLDQVMALGT
jgi:hypothetical protein